MECEDMVAYAAKATKQFQWRSVADALRVSRLLTFVQYDRKSKTLHVAYIRFLPVLNAAKAIPYKSSLLFPQCAQ